MLEFTYRTARSGAITSAIVAVIAIESLAVHFAVATRRPVLAWALTLTSVGAVYWLVRDYLALGSGTVRLSEESVRLAIGRRFDIEIPLASIARAMKPSFRDLPAPGTTQGRDYLNLTKPSAPNMLIALNGVRRVRLAAGIHRDVTRLSFTLDDPAEFLAALEVRRAALQTPQA